MKYTNQLKLIFVLIIIICTVQVMFAQSDGANLTIEPYIFENSKKEKVDAEFGRLKVRENRTKVNSKFIEIAFVRFKSTSQNPGHPIVYLAGGPGGSGIGSAKFRRFNLFMEMRKFGDVIALEQRGTGESKPNLRCQNKLELPFDVALTLESVLKEESEKLKACATEFERQGVDVSAYNTVESANDINDLRIALGAKKLNLWGISYGTHLALATIRQHGKYIDNAILAGVEGVDDTIKLPSYTQEVIVELNRRAKADVELSKSVPDLISLIKKVNNKLEKQPEVVEVTNPQKTEKFNITVGKYDLQYLVSALSGSNQAQAIIPKLYYDMSNGDFSFLAQQMAGYRTGGVSSVMTLAMDCASGISKKRLRRIHKEKQNTLFSNAINDPFPEVCNSIKYKKLGKKFRKRVKSKVKVLFISGTLDGRTPVSNAEYAQKGFKNSTHLIIDGAGHSDPLFLSTPKIAETMFAFMKGDKLSSKIYVEMAKPFQFVPINE